jgi:hypothetical protein
MPRDRRTSRTAGVDPSRWEADVVLRDGSVGHVRPIRPDDADGLRSFHSGQSDESIYLRFFAPIRELSDRDVHRFTHVDNVDRVALVVTVRGAIIGIGRWEPTSQTCSVCGIKNGRKALGIRVWECPECHTLLDRDYNAAVNIMLAAGLAESLNDCGGNIRLRLAGAIPDEAVTTHTVAAA